MSELEIVYWQAGPESEHLVHATLDAAVEEYLEGISIHEAPETIQVRGYARIPAQVDERRVLQGIYEEIEEELGDPDGFAFAVETSEEVQRLAGQLARAVEAHWLTVGYACKAMQEVSIEVMPWVRTHKPEWLGDLSKQGA